MRYCLKQVGPDLLTKDDINIYIGMVVEMAISMSILQKHVSHRGGLVSKTFKTLIMNPTALRSHPVGDCCCMSLPIFSALPLSLHVS